jgi:surface antigen
MSSRHPDPRVSALIHFATPAAGAVEEPRGNAVAAGRSDRPFLRLILCAGLCVTACGCSVSMPMSGFVTDPMTTGSIARPDALLFKALDQEDGRRAKAALAVALDPQGNGASVAWSNPQSGAKGVFVASAPPVARDDLVCRDFKAHVMPDAKSDREVDGSACRDAGGEWRVAEAREKAKAGG